MMLRTRITSSLEKIFCKPELDADPLEKIAFLKGETAAFQLAMRCDEEMLEVVSRAEGPLAKYVEIREVGLVPCTLPAVAEDPFIITSEPGLFPSPLLPHRDPLYTVPGCWNAFWVSLCVPDDFPAGEYEVALDLTWRPSYRHSTDQTPFRESRVTLRAEVLPAVLPEQVLKQTLWFHADCLMTRYNVECWSERHWELIGNYFRDLTSHGSNMILTPLWTLSLDTDIGAERPTVQLLEIAEKGGRYQFDFSRLERWIELAFKSGFRYLEFSHLCTQWGAEFTPKIIVNGEKRFGWHVRAESPEYRSFLEQLLPELTGWLNARGLRERCCFHVSDEPTPANLDSYRRMVDFLSPFFEGWQTLDALSSPRFWLEKLVKCPIPCTEHVEEFMEFDDLPERWVYYCGNWGKGLPNRQFGMPSARNRVFGLLLYLYNFDGFLNWGYNFWYSCLSRNQKLDPWREPDAGRRFRGGGSFMVYPGDDGMPVDGIHYEVFREGLQDLRALRLLESKIGRDKVVALLQEGVRDRLTLNNYPRTSAWLLDVRDRVNEQLKIAFKA